MTLGHYPGQGFVVQNQQQSEGEIYKRNHNKVQDSDVYTDY